jgi:hypothetical protein
MPFFENMKYRLEQTWRHIINPSATPNGEFGKALTTATCSSAVSLASSGGETWFSSYYARSGIFVGDLDFTTSEAAVEKYRIELTRTFSDMLQTALALKGDW